MDFQGKGIHSNSSHRLATILLGELINSGARAVALEDADYVIQLKEGDPERIRLLDRFGNHFLEFTSGVSGSNVPIDVVRAYIQKNLG